ELRQEYAADPAPPLQENLQPPRRSRSHDGERRHLPGMPDAPAAAAIQRNPETFTDSLLPKLPTHPVLRRSAGSLGIAVAPNSRVPVARPVVGRWSGEGHLCGAFL